MNPYQPYSMNSYTQYQQAYPQQFYPQQMQNPQMDRLAQLQSMQQSLQPAQMSPAFQGLTGRIVEDFNVITANDVPMDGNGAVFIKRDGSEIQVRNWTANGTIATTSYIPVLEPKGEQTGILPNQNRELKFDEVLGLIGAVSEKVDGLSARLDDFIKTKASSRTKKEVDE